MPDRAEIGETAMADAEWWMCHDVLVQVAGRLRDGRPLGILTGAGVSIESGVPSAGGVVALLERHGLVVGGHDVVDSGRCQRGRRGVPAGGMRPMVVVVVHPHRQGLTPSLL